MKVEKTVTVPCYDGCGEKIRYTFGKDTVTLVNMDFEKERKLTDCFGTGSLREPYYKLLLNQLMKEVTK